MKTEVIKVPRVLSFVKLNEIIVAYLIARGDKAEVQDVQITNIVPGLSVSNVSNNTNFLESLGLIQRMGKKRFRLTAVGTKYAECLKSNTPEATEQARHILNDAIKGKTLVSETLKFVTERQTVSEKDVKNEIIETWDLKHLKNKSVPARAVIDMLIFAGRLNEHRELRTGENRITSAENIQRTKHASSAPISVVINIDGNIDMTRLKSVIRTIRQALAEDQADN
jgi:hypothetical protein